MGMLLGLLTMVVGLGWLVCFVMVLIKMFQTEGPLYGILGLLCGLYALIWGWMNAEKLNIKNLMMAWTALTVLYFVLYGLTMASMFG